MALTTTLSAPEILRSRLRRVLIEVLAREQGPPIDFDGPVGDPGLFGPKSVTWRVHSDFPGMMAGGVSALMLQTLHPLALSGVWDHSNFRHDLLGRLRRTTAFVAITSYAPRAAAVHMIEQVARIHGRVRGRAEDGRPYSANDPELLVWVHATEMSSFLAGFERFRGCRLTDAERDRYFRETARVAEMLGARRVPKSAAGMARYFERVRPQLRFESRSREVLAVLHDMTIPVPGGKIAREVFLGAGEALLPTWAQKLMGRTPLQRLRAKAAATSLRLVGPTLRAALAEGVVARSSRRMGVDPSRFL